jgi:hypothetical protein
MVIRVAAVVLASSLLAGCGYHLGERMPRGVSTIAVPTFSNDTFPLRRDLEFELTSALRKVVQERTSLGLSEDGIADVTVYGTIKSFHEHVLTEDTLDRKLESLITISVHLKIEDYRSKTVREEVVSESEPLSIIQGEALVVARRRALGGLARKILDIIQVYEPVSSETTGEDD